MLEPVDRVKPVWTSILQLDARTEMLWSAIGRVITWLNTNHGPFYPRTRLWTRRAISISYPLSPDQTYEYSRLPLDLPRPYTSRTSHSRFRIISRFSFGKIFLPFYPIFSFSLPEKTLSSAHEGTNASRKKNFRLPCARAEYKRQEDPLSDRLAPLSEKTEIIQNFLAVKPNRREGRLIHGGQGNGTAVFFGEISSGSSINAKSRRPPAAGKSHGYQVCSISDEGSGARGTTRPTFENERS